MKLEPPFSDHVLCAAQAMESASSIRRTPLFAKNTSSESTFFLKRCISELISSKNKSHAEFAHRNTYLQQDLVLTAAWAQAGLKAC